jgi:hypothetical protein
MHRIYPFHSVTYPHCNFFAMLTFSIVWSTPAGRFGWLTVEECRDRDEAVDCFLEGRSGGQFPADAEIDQIKRV